MYILIPVEMRKNLSIYGYSKKEKEQVPKYGHFLISIGIHLATDQIFFLKMFSDTMLEHFFNSDYFLNPLGIFNNDL